MMRDAIAYREIRPDQGPAPPSPHPPPPPPTPPPTPPSTPPHSRIKATETRHRLPNNGQATPSNEVWVNSVDGRSMGAKRNMNDSAPNNPSHKLGKEVA